MIRRLAGFIREALSGSDSVSSTRILMVLFSLFSMGVIGLVVWHMVRLTDPALLSLFVTFTPTLILSLVGLIGVPYGLNRGMSAVTEIANSLASLKKRDTM